MIYVAQCGTRFKIGYSRSAPLERVQALSVGNPEKISLVCVMPGGKRDERHLHRSFATKREQGEWFNLSCEDLRSLQAIFWVEAPGPRPACKFQTEAQFRGHVEELFFRSVAQHALHLALTMKVPPDPIRDSYKEAMVTTLRGAMMLDFSDRPYFDYPEMYRKWLMAYELVVAEWQDRVARSHAAEQYLRGEISLEQASAALERYDHACSLCNPYDSADRRLRALEPQ